MSSIQEQKGFLEASVLSVYDLPVPDQPDYVSLSACGISKNSGPPLAKHKDRNSFRFASILDNNNTKNDSNGGNDTIKIVAPLSELYRSVLKIRIEYNNNELDNLMADLPLQQLRIHENKWLILNLTHCNAVSLPDTIAKDAPFGIREDQPTIRIKLKLCGPYRPEVAAIMNAANFWFGVVDSVELSTKSTLKKLPKIPVKVNNWMPLLIAPIVAVIVVVSPLLVVVPFLLPLIGAFVAILTLTFLFGGLTYLSTKEGRLRLNTTFGPLLESFVFSRAGQSLVYDIGSRPNPVSVARQVMPDGFWSKLWVSLIIDFIGSSSYLVPVAGEGFDLMWAPTQTVLIEAMYNSSSPNLKYISFFEEILPFTDIFPSATVGWFCEFVPILWRDQTEKNKVDPEVTQAVTSLVKAATNGAISRKRSLNFKN